MAKYQTARRPRPAAQDFHVPDWRGHPSRDPRHLHGEAHSWRRPWAPATRAAVRWVGRVMRTPPDRRTARGEVWGVAMPRWGLQGVKWIHPRQRDGIPSIFLTTGRSNTSYIIVQKKRVICGWKARMIWDGQLPCPRAGVPATRPHRRLRTTAKLQRKLWTWFSRHDEHGNQGCRSTL